VVIDTSFFTGNYPEEASIDGCALAGTPSAVLLTSADVEWFSLLAPSKLAGNVANSFEVISDRRVTHLRLNIFPDGGVARLRVHGEAVPDPRIFSPGREVDLAAIENGGHVIACSDMHYGNPQSLIMPGRSTHMGDGWETKRRRGPGHDWTIVRLARRGTIERIELDTDHYKGNAPGRVMLECADASGGFDAATVAWRPLVAEQAVEPHARHRFEDLDSGLATHVRLNIYPDGGVARLRLFGRVAP
jgi:allantoicase